MVALEVNGLHKSFAKNHVLKGVDFTLEEGQVLAVIGSSGSGKTTLLRCINFLETADKGQVLVNGEIVFDSDSTAKQSAKERREKQKKIGLVFQSFNLFPQYTVMENITLAPRLHAKERPDYRQNKKQILEEIDAMALDILAEVGLSDKTNAYPCELSGGQQQRVSIARALALQPSILFFDEPTSALDPELTGEILRVIKALANKKRTMVIVTHEMKFAHDVADKIIFMDKGVIAEEGTPDELFGENSSERLRSFIGKFDR